MHYFISLDGKTFLIIPTHLLGKEFNTNKTLKFIFEKKILNKDTSVSIFTVSGFFACDWCSRRDGGSDSLDCNTCDSRWHHFLFSPEILLSNFTRC